MNDSSKVLEAVFVSFKAQEHEITINPNKYQPFEAPSKPETMKGTNSPRNFMKLL